MTVADNIADAKRHHKKHGDMDGKTCLLSMCALHYPCWCAKYEPYVQNHTNIDRPFFHHTPPDVSIETIIDIDGMIRKAGELSDALWKLKGNRVQITISRVLL